MMSSPLWSALLPSGRRKILEAPTLIARRVRRMTSTRWMTTISRRLCLDILNMFEGIGALKGVPFDYSKEKAMSKYRGKPYVFAKTAYSLQSGLEVDFQLYDKKRRKVGIIVLKQTETTTQDADQNKNSGTIAYTNELGVWYTYGIQSTRDGTKYGAAAKMMRYRTEAERDAKAAKAAVAAQRRAAKKFL